MKIHATTDYSIRILGYLYQRDNRKVKGEVIANDLGITFLYFMKVAKLLREGGLIASVQGCNGGFLLKKGADEINVYDVVKIMEGDILTAQFLEDKERVQENCPALEYWKTVREAMAFMMKNTTIADIYGRNQDGGFKAEHSILYGNEEIFRMWKERKGQKKALV